MTNKPKFTPDITLGSMISFVAIVFATTGKIALFDFFGNQFGARDEAGAVEVETS